MATRYRAMRASLFVVSLAALPIVSYTLCCGSCTGNCTTVCNNTAVPTSAYTSPYTVCTDCLRPSKLNDTVHELYEGVLHPAGVTLDSHGHLYLLDRNRSAAIDRLFR